MSVDFVAHVTGLQLGCSAFGFRECMILTGDHADIAQRIVMSVSFSWARARDATRSMPIGMGRYLDREVRSSPIGEGRRRVAHDHVGGRNTSLPPRTQVGVGLEVSEGLRDSAPPQAASPSLL